MVSPRGLPVTVQLVVFANSLAARYAINTSLSFTNGKGKAPEKVSHPC